MSFPRQAAVKRGNPMNHGQLAKLTVVLVGTGFSIVGLLEALFGVVTKCKKRSLEIDERSTLTPEQLDLKTKLMWDPLFRRRDVDTLKETSTRIREHQMDGSFREAFVEAAKKGETVDFDKMKEGITGKFVFTRSRKKREAAKEKDDA